MTHARWPLALPLVAAVATVSWLLLRDDRASLADPPAGTAVAERSEAERPVGADGAAASPSLPVVDDRSRVQAEVEPSAGRPDPERVRIRVVRAVDGEPVPFAAVHFALADQDWRNPVHRRSMLATPDPIDRLIARGGRTQADARGVAVVHRVGSTLVVAAHEGMFGKVDIEGPEPEGGFVVAIAPDGVIAVRVLMADGRPAAKARVGLRGLRCEAGALAADRSAAVAAARRAVTEGDGGIERTIELAVADERGEAVLRHPRLHGVTSDGRVLAEVEVVVIAPGIDAVSAPVDLESPPNGPIELRLPPCGSLRVVAVFDDGTVDESVQSRMDIAVLGSGASCRGELVDGEMLHPYVGLGLDYNGWCYGDTRFWGSGPGPREVGEERRLPLRSPGASTLSATVLDADRRPIAKGRLRWTVRCGDLADVRLGAIESGRAAVQMRDRDLTGKQVEIAFQLMEADGRATGLAAGPRTFDITSRRQDLGPIVLTAMPEFARGVVIGPDPLPEFTFSYARQVPGENGVLEWSDADDVGTAFGPDGSFRILAASPLPVRLAVRCSSCERLAPIDVRPGDHVRIELVVAADMRLSMRADERLLQHPDLLVVDWRKADAESRAGPWEQEEPLRQGDVLVARIGGLEAGSYSVRLRTVGDPDPVVQIDDLAVARGQSLGDPRLAAIDLRGMVHVVRLRTVDASMAFTEVYADCWAARTDRVESEERWFADGICWWACAKEVDVVIDPYEGRALRYRGPPQDADIRIERGFEVAFDMVCPDELPADHTWMVRLERLDQPPDFLSAFGIERERGYTTTLAAGEREIVGIGSPGNYEVVLQLARHLDDGSLAPGVVLQTRTVGLFQEGAQHFEVSAEALRTAIAERKQPR